VCGGDAGLCQITFTDCCCFVVDQKTDRRRSYDSSHPQRVSRTARDENDYLDQSSRRGAACSSKSANCDRRSHINAAGHTEQGSVDGHCCTARSKAEENRAALPLDAEKAEGMGTRMESGSTSAPVPKQQQQPSARLYRLVIQETFRDQQTACGSSSQSEDSSSEQRRTKRCRLSTYGSESGKQSHAGSSDSAAEVTQTSRVIQVASGRHTDAVSAVSAMRYNLRSAKDCHEPHLCNSSSQHVTGKSSVAAAASHKKKKSAAENVASLDREVKWKDGEKKDDERRLFRLEQRSSAFKSPSSRGTVNVEGETRKHSSSCGKDANGPAQKLFHSVPDEEISISCARRDKGSIQGKARSQCHLLSGEDLHVNSRSRSSMQVSASWHSSTSHVKTLDNSRAAAYADRVGPQRCNKESRQTEPEICGGSREYRSTKNVCDAEQSFVKIGCEEISISRDSREEANVSEDWEDDLCVIPSVACNVTVTSDVVAGSVEEAVVGEYVEVLLHDSYVTADDGSMACAGNKTVLPLPAVGNEEEICDTVERQAEMSVDPSDIQDLSLVRMDSDSVGEQAESEAHAAVECFITADVSLKRETFSLSVSDEDNPCVYTVCEITVCENSGKQDMDACDCDATDGGEEELSVSLPCDNPASSGAPQEPSQQSDVEYNELCEVIEQEVLVPFESGADEDRFREQSSEKCADKVSSGKQFSLVKFNFSNQFQL